MKKISRLKEDLDKCFEMKDLGHATEILACTLFKF